MLMRKNANWVFAFAFMWETYNANWKLHLKSWFYFVNFFSLHFLYIIHSCHMTMKLIKASVSVVLDMYLRFSWLSLVNFLNVHHYFTLSGTFWFLSILLKLSAINPFSDIFSCFSYWYRKKLSTTSVVNNLYFKFATNAVKQSGTFN